MTVDEVRELLDNGDELDSNDYEYYELVCDHCRKQDRHYLRYMSNTICFGCAKQFDMGGILDGKKGSDVI